MENSLFVSVRCPECGGAVRHLEGAYTFTCSFCASVLRSETEGLTLRYIIPSRVDRGDIVGALQGLSEGQGGPGDDREIERVVTVYKPFWYFKGMVYSCRSNGERNDIDAKTWWYTFQANTEFAPSLRSLGLRSEVLTVEAYDSDRFKEEAVILPVTIERSEAEREAIDTAEQEAGSPGPQWKYHKTTVIGERLFLIYYPVVVVSHVEGDSVRVTLLDGVSASHVGAGSGELSWDDVDDVKDTPYHLRIVTHRCRNCGHDLPSGDFDIIFYCRHCTRLWLLKGNDYHPQKVTLIKAEDAKNSVYIPFWMFEIVISSESAAISLETVGDLGRFMKMGQYLLRDAEAERPLRFYIPAIVARNARTVIKLAERISTFQKEFPVDQSATLPEQGVWNASLPAEEAEELVSSVLFLVIGRIDRKAVQLYRDHAVTVTDRQLVWYPFSAEGGYLIDLFHNYNVPRQSLDITVY